MDANAHSGEVFTHEFFAPPSYPGAIQRDELLNRLLRTPACRRGAEGRGQQQPWTGAEAAGGSMAARAPAGNMGFSPLVGSIGRRRRSSSRAFGEGETKRRPTGPRYTNG
ncbi:hypothetical protein [Solimonas soli]|uniref:hypothetical protein n=1 Tax=Solimonas soli TaxID=413479 RepID=UPI0012F9F25D|nr:hypothetical protein [Solimonas soli]